MRSWRRVGNTEAKSFFVGQSFNLSIRVRSPSFKRTRKIQNKNLKKYQ